MAPRGCMQIYIIFAGLIVLNEPILVQAVCTRQATGFACALCVLCTARTAPEFQALRPRCVLQNFEAADPKAWCISKGDLCLLVVYIGHGRSLISQT